MNTVLDLLKQTVELEKKAYTERITAFSSTSIAALSQAGVEFEKAARLVSKVCDQDPSLAAAYGNVALLEKVAQYIEELEARPVQEVAAPAPVITEEMSKLASLGFTPEEIHTMQEVNDALLNKVASAVSAPVEMGSPAGFPREKTDPLLEFMLS